MGKDTDVQHHDARVLRDWAFGFDVRHLASKGFGVHVLSFLVVGSLSRIFWKLRTSDDFLNLESSDRPAGHAS